MCCVRASLKCDSGSPWLYRYHRSRFPLWKNHTCLVHWFLAVALTRWLELQPSASTWGISWHNQPDITYYGKFVPGNHGDVVAFEESRQTVTLACILTGGFPGTASAGFLKTGGPETNHDQEEKTLNHEILKYLYICQTGRENAQSSALWFNFLTESLHLSFFGHFSFFAGGLKMSFIPWHRKGALGAII